MKENVKNEQIWLRVEPCQKEEIKNEARERGLTLSEYVRQLVFYNRNLESTATKKFEMNVGDYLIFEKLVAEKEFEKACEFIDAAMGVKPLAALNDCVKE